MAAITNLLDADGLQFGTFRCRPDDPRWREDNWIGDGHHVVFPRRAVVIGQRGHRPWVTNPNHAVFYDSGQTYRRSLLSPDGDVSRFAILGPDLAHELLSMGPNADGEHFRVVGGPISDEVALNVHLLGTGLESGRVDAATAESSLLGILDAVVRGAHQPTGASAVHRRSTAKARRTLVEDAKAHLSVAFAERGSVREVARAVGASPFHLARVFRDETGVGLHAYRERLRLRAALERLAEGEDDLARLAQDLGYSSHGHLDVRFRLAFSQTPSAIRSAA